MKKHVLPAVAGLALLASAGVVAAETLVLTPEETTTIREYVTTQKVTPVEAPSGFTVSVGATVPDTIKLYAVDSPKIKNKYEYVVIGKQTVLVEPGTRKIVQVINSVRSAIQENGVSGLLERLPEPLQGLAGRALQDQDYCIVQLHVES